ncbi:MAG: permease, partial [Phascolarctobacterium sp.]
MFDFIMQQILGMQWLSKLIWQLLESILGATQASPLWGSVHFFLYDTIKISILLVSLIFMITYIQSYFPPEKTKRILTGFRGVKGAIIAALLGTVTPFCSCSSIPIFIG